MGTTATDRFLSCAEDVVARIDRSAVEALALRLVALRSRGGRLFLLGVGGSAANASHAVNDFRKICGIEAYAPTDNVSELTARANDEGWETIFVEWLRGSRLNRDDALLVLSVGGGSIEYGVSVCLVHAVDEARARGATVLGIVGRDGGHTGRAADCIVLVPTVNTDLVTPLVEAMQSLVLHSLVSHPSLATGRTKWESIAPGQVSRV